MKYRVKHIVLMIVTAFAAMAAVGPGNSIAGDAGPLVSTDWLDKHGGDKGIVIVDVRTGANYAFAHIPRAVSIPYATIEPKCEKACYVIPGEKKITEMFRNAGINNNSHVIVYAHGNNVSDASKAGAAYWILKAMGHKKVSMLNGGFTKWTFEGRVVTREIPSVTKGNFRAADDRALIAVTSDVTKATDKGGAILVDARNSVQYFGHEKRADVPCFGHIPGAVNLPADFLSNAGINRAPATIKSKDDLSKIVLGAGIPADKKVRLIVYCNTAQLAGLNYLVLKDILGYRNVSVYDGSMLEYCGSGLPVERFSWGLSKRQNL